MKAVFSENYSVDTKGHPWNAYKYQEIINRLLDEKLLDEQDIIHVDEAKDKDILLVHTAEWLNKLKNLPLPREDELGLELSVVNREMVKLFRTFAQGTITAGFQALEDGICVHIGGGMHHSYPGYGSGFCMLNDIAIGIKVMLEKRPFKKMLVIDCDLHQGDATAKIFEDDDRIFTFSIHEMNAFPYHLGDIKSDLDIGLPPRLEDKEYLEKLTEALDYIFSNNEPFEFIHYQAGADPYELDPLGGLNVSLEGMIQRDYLVLSEASKRDIPIVVTLGGGYSNNVVEVHLNTVKTAIGISKH